MIELRVFSAQGVDKFREHILALKNHPKISHPDLNSEPYSSKFKIHVKIDEKKTFSTRMEMGNYLSKSFEEAGVWRSNIIGNSGLWTWLAYIWFDQLSPIGKGKRIIRETAKYICSSNYTDYYRHYVAATYDIYSLYGEKNSRLFLYNPVHEHNDFVEQLASRQFIISNPSLIEVASRLYWDKSKDFPKRGAQSRNRPGNHRRLIKVFAQFELTYDIYSMTSDEILSLLSTEFNDWKR